MYSQILHDLLICSITGSIMLFLSIASRMFLKRRSADQHMMLFAALIMFIIPVSSFFAVPKTVVIELQDSSPVQPIIYAAASESGMDTARFIFVLWAGISLLLIVKNAVSYIRLTTEVRRCQLINDDRIRNIFESCAKHVGIKRRIGLKISSELISPVMFGVIRPVLIIPDREFSDRELEMIITHELTHCRHFDTAFKILSVTAACIHWFNPAVYILKRCIGESCEQWCDETVLRLLRIDDKKEYGRLLLSVMENGRKGTAYTMSMSASKRQLKKRLKKIVQYREATRTAKAVGVITAVSLSVCSVTAFGFSKAADIMPDNLSEAIKPRSELPRAEEEVKRALPEETEIPQPVQTEYIPAEQPLIEPSYAPEVTVEPDAAEEQTPQPEAERVASYTFTLEDEAAEPPVDESDLMLEKGAGYVLNVDDGSIYSVLMTAAEDIQLVINSELSSDITLIHNGKSAEAGSFLLDAGQGDIYELRADMTEGGKIYINCR